MAVTHKTMRERALADFTVRLADPADDAFEIVMRTGYASAWVERDRDGAVESFRLEPGTPAGGVHIAIDVPGPMLDHCEVSGDRSLVAAHIARVAWEQAPDVWDDELGIEPTISREDLRAIGEALFGEDWQRPLARALGPLHPAGPRDSIDDRLVRRWVAGERPIPPWVRGAARRVALQEKLALQKRIAVLDDLLRG